ncbi:MAG: hypothetical protein A2V88_02065 [Elusimicrobia bacterium RBG_16_66_12]|nr:MAG: hypothetical protein A2V88_02065 [Elusimicrobia bacterium RBG_16_66_12]
MKKTMMTLTLALAAPAAFGAGAAAPAQVQNLRSEVKRDEGDLSAKWKTARSERGVLLGRRKSELAKIKTGPGTRAEKKTARQAVHRKYAALLKEARAKIQAERSRRREEMKGKRNQILRLRVTP